MSLYSPVQTSSGAVLQAGLPFCAVPDGEGAALLVRGVVVATYVVDDPAHPYAGQNPAAIYCDVLAYTALKGGRIYPINRCLVKQEGAHSQGGAIWKPRAAQQTLAGGLISQATIPDPTQLDGDHVLVGFIDDMRSQPVILGALPHPYADIGQGNAPIGQRVRLRLVDGDPCLYSHHGVFWGATDGGDAVMDASGGQGGGRLPGGGLAPQLPGQGNVVLNAGPTAGRKTRVGTPTLPLATETLDATGLKLQFAGPGGFAIAGAAGPILAVAGGGPGAGLSIGSGSTQAADASKVQAALAALVAYIDGHIHFSSSPGSPTTPPTVPAPPSASPPVSALAAGGLSLPGV